MDERKWQQLAMELSLSKLDDLLLSEISLCEEIDSICSLTNPASMLKCSSDDSYFSEHLAVLDAYQNPIIVYPCGDSFKLISGIFTYQMQHKYNSKQSELGSESHRKTPVIMLRDKPKLEIIQLFILNELTRIILRQYSGIPSNKIGNYLKIWFHTDKVSLFENRHWQVLFPHINNQKTLSEWLHISTKVLKGLS